MDFSSGGLRVVVLGAFLLSCGGTAIGPTGNTEGGLDSFAANGCGGFGPLAFNGSPGAPADPCGPCLDGVLVCATPNLLACAGARLAAACPDASSPATDAEAGLSDDASDATVEDAGADSDATSAGGADADATSVVTDASDSGSLGDAASVDGGALDGQQVDASSIKDAGVGGASDAPAEAAPYDGGSGWQSVDGGPPVTTYGDGGLPAVRCLSLPTNDLLVAPTGGGLFASVGSTSALYGNSVVRIDPLSVAVSATVFSGSEPAALAMSDDGASLYVGLNGSDSVMRIDPATGIHDPPVNLGSTQFSGPRTAGQIAAVPGSSTQFVVARRNAGYSPSFAGLALYDGATLLGEWNAFTGGESIAFVSPTVLFGYNNETTGFDLYELTLTPTGFQVGADTMGLISGFYATIRAEGGWIFATTGKAVVASTAQAAGQYATSGPVWPSPDGANVWFLTSAEVLQDFDRTTFLSNRSITLPSIASGATPLSLDGLSSTAFVFRTSTGVCIATISP